MSAPIHMIKAPAKVNLNLAVTGRTREGYHELLSLVVFTEFGDELHITPSSHLQVDVSGAFAPHLSAAGGEQLLSKAAALYQEITGRDQAYHICLDKHIPLGGGLGGGCGCCCCCSRRKRNSNNTNSNNKFNHKTNNKE